MVRPGVFRVHPASVGSLGCTLGVVRGSWDHCGARWWSSGSFGVAELTGERPGGRRIYPGPLCSLGYAQGFVRSSGVAGFTWVPSVSHAAPWGLSRSSGVAGFTRVRSARLRVHPGSLGTLGGCRVHPGSLDSMWCAMGVVRFIQGR